MLRRAAQLLVQAQQLEEIADGLALGIEAQISIAVDELFPPEYLSSALQGLSLAYPNTRVQLFETVLSGGPEKLVAGEVELLVAGQVPQGFLGEPVMQAQFIAVAHPDHPLHQLRRPINLADLSAHRQLVVRDSALGERADVGWLGAEQRWTVSHVATSVDMVRRGMGFAWLPASRVRPHIEQGTLAELPLETGARRATTLYLTHAGEDRAGPAVRHLAGLLTEACASYEKFL
jgi:DNA-binding transcriptional LysR family regulator